MNKKILKMLYLIKKSIYIIKNEGIKIFFKKIYLYFRPFSETKIKKEKLIIPILVNEFNIIDDKVSVIIPTKNAGNDFQFLLNKIKIQKNLKEIEIIIIDSGSNDNTLEIGKKYTNLIFSIPPEEFNHSKTRNIAAQKATGNYLLFLTQDVIPISEYMIYDMLKISKSDSKISIITCRQIPRSDSDLMAIYMHYSFYKTIDIYNDLIVSSNNLNQLSPIQKRKISQTTNTCSLINKNLFMNYKFYNDYAEDLNLSLRLLRDGYKICYLYSHAVIHSHNRDCLYYFKANYKDRKFIVPLLGIKTFDWNLYDINLVIKSTIIFYNICKLLIKKYNLEILIEKMRNLFYENFNLKELIISNQDNIEKLFYNIDINYFIINNNLKIEPNIINILLNNFYNNIINFKEFLSIYGIVGKDELENTILKICASVIGTVLGDYYCYLKEHNLLSNDIINLDKIISRGI